MTINELRKRLQARLSDIQRRGAEAFGQADAAGVEGALAELTGIQTFIGELDGWEREFVPVAEATLAPAVSHAPPASAAAPTPVEPPPTPARPEPPAPEPEAPKPQTAERGEAKAKGAAIKRRLAKERDEFVAECRKLELRGRTPLGEREVAQLKALACLGRALDEEATRTLGIDRDVQDFNKGLLSRFRDDREEHFFGFEFVKVRLEPDLWRRLREAYSLTSRAIEAVEWVESDPDITEEVRRRMLFMAAASESLLYRLLAEGAHQYDQQQDDLHRRIVELQNRYDLGEIPWWHHTGPKRKTEADLRKEAEELAEYLKEQRKHADRRTVRQGALAAIEAAIAQTNEDGFQARLNAAVAAALEAGVPPSSLDLRRLLMPFWSYLEAGANKKAAKLRQTLEAIANSGGTQAGEDAGEEEVPVDSGHEARLAAVRKHLKGKTVLFVGGNKGQIQRRDELRKALGLKELLWPDCEEHSDLSVFAGPLNKADAACLLVKFCRHAYSEVLDDAKRQGKEVARLPAGLSLNRVTFDLFQQLVMGSRTSGPL